MENRIELGDFVTLAISEIAKGVGNAIELLADKGVIVNPGLTCEGDVEYDGTGIHRHVQHLDFDLTVSASSRAGAKAGVSADLLHVVSASIGSGSGHESQVVNRLRFSLPVCFQTNANIKKTNSGV